MPLNKLHSIYIFTYIVLIDKEEETKSNTYFDENVTKMQSINNVILSKDAKTFKNLIITEF